MTIHLFLFILLLILTIVPIFIKLNNGSLNCDSSWNRHIVDIEKVLLNTDIDGWIRPHWHLTTTVANIVIQDRILLSLLAVRALAPSRQICPRKGSAIGRISYSFASLHVGKKVRFLLNLRSLLNLAFNN